jgi:hypothetical protein
MSPEAEALFTLAQRLPEAEQEFLAYRILEPVAKEPVLTREQMAELDQIDAEDQANGFADYISAEDALRMLRVQLEEYRSAEASSPRQA